MKRRANAIVDYDSSGNEDEHEIELRPPRKRKLPVLSSTLVIPVPVDDPALHQGRKRLVPHVDGNWAAHAYVSIIVNRSHAMYPLLEAVMSEAQRLVPALHSFVSSQGTSKHDIELHVSLSRPIFIRAHQKEELRRAVRSLAQRPPFSLSFTSFAELQNDERTRTFLTVEIGAGHHELRKLCGDLEPLLQKLRQPSYYSSPRFHASIAWALLDRSQNTVAEAEVNLAAEDPLLDPITPPDMNRKSKSRTESQSPVDFATVSGFPELIEKLNREFGDRLSSPSVGSFDVENISLKIGKDGLKIALDYCRKMSLARFFGGHRYPEWIKITST